MSKIRRLNESDLGDFFYLRLEGLLRAPTAFGGSYEDEKKSGPGFYETILKTMASSNVIFGAFEEDSLVGCVGLYQEKGSKAKHKAVIWGMFVKESFQQRGIGRQLINEAIEHARGLEGVVQIHLSLEAGNHRAKALYESLGFKAWGIEPRALRIENKYYDEEQMVLILE